MVLKRGYGLPERDRRHGPVTRRVVIRDYRRALVVPVLGMPDAAFFGPAG